MERCKGPKSDSAFPGVQWVALPAWVRNWPVLCHAIPEGQETLWWLYFPSSHRKGQLSRQRGCLQPLSHYMGDTGWLARNRGGTSLGQQSFQSSMAKSRRCSLYYETVTLVAEGITGPASTRGLGPSAPAIPSHHSLPVVGTVVPKLLPGQIHSQLKQFQS